MTEAQMIEIYERLLRLTCAGVIDWTRSDTREYRISFPHSSVSVGMEPDLAGSDFAYIKVYNDQGAVIACAATGPHGFLELDLDVRLFRVDPLPLYNATLETYLKYAETSANILEELKKLEQEISKSQVSKG